MTIPVPWSPPRRVGTKKGLKKLLKAIRKVSASLPVAGDSLPVAGDGRLFQLDGYGRLALCKKIKGRRRKRSVV
jgi:hypothetical protein